MKVLIFLSKHPVTLIFYGLYCWFWYKVLKMHFAYKIPYKGPDQIGHGEAIGYVIIGMFLIATIFCLIMAINAACRKEHQLFYIVMIAFILFPFALLSL